MLKNKDLKVGHVYFGGIYHKETVKYLGIKKYENTNKEYHSFEYVYPHEKVAGYGQTDDMVDIEGYKIDQTLTVLYGAKF